MKTYDDLTTRVNRLSTELFSLYGLIDQKFGHDLDLVKDLVKVAYQTMDLYFLTDYCSVEKRDLDLPLKDSDDELPF